MSRIITGIITGIIDTNQDFRDYRSSDQENTNRKIDRHLLWGNQT